MAWNKAIECFSTMSITEMLCVNLSAYTEIKLYRACKAIHYGNQLRCDWWQNMERMIQIALSKHNLPHDNWYSPRRSKLAGATKELTLRAADSENASYSYSSAEDGS